MKRSSLALGHFIHAVRVGAGRVAPLCMTCGRPVDSEQLVEGEPGRTTTASVLVKHHGTEELREFKMGTVAWTYEQLGKYMHAAHWFDPLGHDGAVNITRPNHEDMR